MALGTARDSAGSDVAYMGRTAKSQLASTFFGKLPLEVREMIYAECFVASGVKQHVYQSHDGRLTHSPCILEPGECDERNDEFQRMMSRQGQNRRGSRSRSSLVVDEVWAARFSSPWHEHWRCEEAMLHFEKAAPDSPRLAHRHPPRRRYRTLFLPILLLCKRAYYEAYHSLYGSTTFVFTDLETAHRMLVCRQSAIPTSILRSVDFSLVLSYHTLHEQRMHETNGPWAQLCIKLSDMARFSSLRSALIRLDLAADDEDEAGDWCRVRERWALSAIRGILARRLTVELPDAAHPEWSWTRKYQYAEGDETPFRLERYQKMRWVSVGDGRRVESLVDPPSRMSSAEGRSPEPISGSLLQKATRGLKELVLR